MKHKKKVYVIWVTIILAITGGIAFYHLVYAPARFNEVRETVHACIRDKIQGEIEQGWSAVQVANDIENGIPRRPTVLLECLSECREQLKGLPLGTPWKQNYCEEDFVQGEPLPGWSCREFYGGGMTVVGYVVASYCHYVGEENFRQALSMLKGRRKGRRNSVLRGGTSVESPNGEEATQSRSTSYGRADRLIDAGIDRVTPESKGTTREMQREGVKFLLDPNDKRRGKHLDKMLDAAKRSGEGK